MVCVCSVLILNQKNQIQKEEKKNKNLALFKTNNFWFISKS